MLLTFGLQVALIGLGIVFVALTFLIGVIKVMAVATGNREVKKTPKVAAPVTKGADPAAAVKKEDDSDVIAVIAATVAFLTQGRMSIKTITRVPGGHAPSWSLAGRQETMNLRQF
ncbi:hypothetical protein BR63_06365 [Thermanaerosceptrum fracticalcis]|uniref:Uncharacterized protein n=1 Tax=Thermanaerosceptrum fracticalcis TaxID=1712410 RepID=A0A7G6E1L6_THEFR|nr:OadG family protein [Thermanaerosceptrum fracticalcis]QNB45970.1 hypothetical protein BR63_06365 [Thermanaerosceptrum fracticalcis]